MLLEEPAIRLIFVALLWLLVLRPAEAIPVFAHRYGFECQTCHSVIPHLNAFGEAFLAAGYRLAGLTPRPAFPIATKINLVYTGEPSGTRLPKAVVDEIELLSGGSVGKRFSYFLEQYVVDGGQPGSVRDAWLAYHSRDALGPRAWSLSAGQFTLPLPLDPETFRETFAHYAIFDQTAGGNPFNFFAPKIGVMAQLGDGLHGFSLALAGLQGHDRQSGLPARGVDTMLAAKETSGGWMLSAYRYDGTRPLLSADRFWRQGYALEFSRDRWTFQNLWQTGWDSSAGTISSGGFSQLRYAFAPRWFGLARLDATNDPTNGTQRAFTLLAGFRPARNSRITIEDTLTHTPAAKHVFSTQLTIGY